MPGSENLYRPSAEVSHEKTEAAMKSAKRSDTKLKAAADNCEAIKKMVPVENPIHNTSPNATNIQD